jgi:hypothetical protein
MGSNLKCLSPLEMSNNNSGSETPSGEIEVHGKKYYIYL